MFGIDDAIGAGLGVIGKIIDRVIPDKEAQDKAKLALLEMQQRGELAQLDAALKSDLGQMDINKQEAASSSLFVAGWRPMQKTLDEAVEAFADATRGEYERLKEFGINAEVSGNQVTLSWMQNGQQMEKTVTKNAENIGKALTGVWTDMTGPARSAGPAGSPCTTAGRSRSASAPRRKKPSRWPPCRTWPIPATTPFIS